MSLDLAQHVDWSSDDDYYYAAVQLRTPDGQIGTIEVRVDRPWVIRTAQAVRKRLLATAPAGVDVGAWQNPSDPQRFVKLCQYVAGEEVKRQLTEQVKRDGVVIAPWFGEWTLATADAAYRLIRAAQAGDETSVQQLERLREHAETGDPAAAKALAMINSVAKLVARNLPPPSVVASQVSVEGGALPRAPLRRRVVRTPPRALPPRRPTPPPKPGARRGAAPAPTRAPSGVTGPRGAVAPTASATGKPVAGPTAATRASLAALRPAVLQALVPKPLVSTAQPAVPPSLYNPLAQYPYGYPYGMGPSMGPGDFGGGGGGYGGDMGPDDFLAPEEDDGAGDTFDDDGTYFEDEGLTDSDFPEQPEQFAVGEYPEEIGQSLNNEDEPPPDNEDGPFPDEGTIATRT